MCSSPTRCSQVVQSLVSLIWPLRFCHDFRPFFTIHDSEFKEYTSCVHAPPHVILGVTNPFFTKTLLHWPHIIRLGDRQSDEALRVNARRIFARNLDEGRTLDTKPGLYSQYKPFLAKDKSLVKNIRKGIQSQRPSEVQSMIVRRHFLELTQSFMIPLERYIASLMPLRRQISPFKTSPQARRFDLSEFVSSIGDCGPGLTSGLKGDWVGLYRIFANSANFDGWLRNRLNEVDKQLQLVHLNVFCSVDLTEFKLASRHEVELVDLVLKLRDKLEFASDNTDSVSETQRTRLQMQLNTVLEAVDEDLQHVLMSNIELRKTDISAS